MGQYANYQEDAASQSRLAYWLAPYLGYPKPDSMSRLAQVMYCPGFEKYGYNVTTMDDRICYGLNNPAYFKDETTGKPYLTFRPFGYPNNVDRPHRLSEIAAQKPLTDVWVMTDLDKVAVVDVSNTWRPQLPDKPVHGSVRNYLYFDGHVGTKKPSAKPGYL